MIRQAIVTISAAIALSGCSYLGIEGLDDPFQPDLMETARADPSLATFVAAVDAAGLTGTLEGLGPITVFAPNNAAFDGLPAGTMDQLMEPQNLSRLRQIVEFHIVAQALPARTLTGQTTEATSVEGGTLDIDGTGAAVKVDRGTVISADIGASNGTIHIIDAVLIP